jgi:hypothetical protein
MKKLNFPPSIVQIDLDHQAVAPRIAVVRLSIAARHRRLIIVIEAWSVVWNVVSIVVWIAVVAVVLVITRVLLLADLRVARTCNPDRRRNLIVDRRRRIFTDVRVRRRRTADKLVLIVLMNATRGSSFVIFWLVQLSVILKC